MKKERHKKQLYFFLFATATTLITTDVSKEEQILNNAVNLNRYPEAQGIVKANGDIILTQPTKESGKSNDQKKSEDKSNNGKDSGSNNERSTADKFQ